MNSEEIMRRCRVAAEKLESVKTDGTAMGDDKAEEVLDEVLSELNEVPGEHAKTLRKSATLYLDVMLDR